MGIRLKIILAFLLCFGLMAAIGLTLLERSVDQSYDAIERNDIAANMGRVEQSFAASAASLKNQTNDWAVWSEMYRYAVKPDPAWANENIGEDALAPADLSMVMVFGKSGRLLTSSSIKREGATLAIRAPQMAPYLDWIKRQPARCGIIRIDAGLMLTCWAGIVHSNALGAAVGTVVMGRLLDAARVATLHEQTRLSFALTERRELAAGLTRWSTPLSPGVIGSGEFWTVADADTYHLAYPVQDILGKDVGQITLDVTRAVHKQGLLLYQQMRRQLAWTVLAMTVMLGLALHFILIRRLRRFAGQLDALESESNWARRIDVGGRDELGLVATSFNRLLALIQSQLAGLRQLLDAKESAIRLIEATQAQLIVSEQNALLGQQRVSNLLDNSGQGFFSFAPDLVIDPEVSRACQTMLACSPAGRHAAQVLFADDPRLAELFCAVIAAVVAEADPKVRAIMLSLLPKEIRRHDVLLKAEYRPLENGRLMVVLTDISEERRLEAMLQSERRRLEFIVAAVSDRPSFFDAIDGFSEFLARRLPSLLDHRAEPHRAASQLYRELHTYKGLLNQFAFIKSPAALHEAEARLAGLLPGGALTPAMLADAVSPQHLRSLFDDDLALLSEALGKDFLDHRERLAVSCEQAAQLEELATRLLRGEPIDVSATRLRRLLDDLLMLRKVTFNSVLGDFDGLVKQVARRLDKQVAPIDVDGGNDLWIDRQRCQAFIHCLGHVFRNAVAHGLEAPEARWAADKDEAGRITCRVALAGDAIVLSIADDGAGIDLDALRQRAVAAAIYGADEVGQVADAEIAALIFREQMSTGLTVTELSGRGAGLAAVLSETRRLGGEVVVETQAGKGTRLVFTLPAPSLLQGRATATADDLDAAWSTEHQRRRAGKSFKHTSSIAK